MGGIRVSRKQAKNMKSDHDISRPVQAWRALVRASICGYVDAYSLLNLGVYASFMTGNTTSGGVDAGEIRIAAAAHSLLPIPFFMLGILLGTVLVQTHEARALHRLSALVGALLALDVLASFWAGPGWFSIMILSSSMGLLNTSVTEVGGQSVSLGFMTGDLNSLARSIATGIQRKPVAEGSWGLPARVALLAALWFAFLAGAITGTILDHRLAARTLAFPALILLVFAVLERARLQRPDTVI